MATRKLVICNGQSPMGPWHDLASWVADRGDLSMILAPRTVSGSANVMFTVPFSIPGFTAPFSLRGIAIETLRYCVFYNPCATGYSSYPGTCRVAPIGSLPNGLAHTTTSVIVEQRFTTWSPPASITRKLTGTVHTVTAVAPLTFTFADADVNVGTERITITGHGLSANMTVRLMSTGTLPVGLSPLTVYFVRVVDPNTIELALTSGGPAVNIVSAAGGGVHTLMHAFATATEPATVGTRLSVTPAFDPPPASNEEFTFTHAVLFNTFADANVDVSTNRITLAGGGGAIPGHNLPDGAEVQLTTTGVLPGGLALVTNYFVRRINATTIELSLTSGGAAVDIVSAAGGGTHTIVPKTVVPLGLHYGLLRPGDLRGLRLRCVAATTPGNVGQTRNITAWDPVTLSVTIASAFGGAVTAGDTFDIEPINGTTFPRFCMWLPWCPFERNLSASALGEFSKVNPYPPGFDYPSHWHLPQVYGASNQPISDTASLKLTLGASIAWHVGGGVRLSEQFGETVFMLPSDFGGSSTAHREYQLGTRTVGWYDPTQQNHWSTATSNGAYARWLEEVDAAVAAATAVGDTLALQVIFRGQGDADAGTGLNGYTTSASTVLGMQVWRDKYLASNRTIHRRMREDLKARGLWPLDAFKLPIVRKLVSRDTVDQVVVEDGSKTSVEEVNRAIQQLVDEDRYARAWDPTGLFLWDGIHEGGYELDKIERGLIEAYLDILAATDQSGEVALCNIALTHIGAAAIVTAINPPDGSAEAAHCATFYERARNAVLELGGWGFATKRRPLSPTTSNASSYAYAYVKPVDALRVLSVLPPGVDNDYVSSVSSNRSASGTAPGGDLPPGAEPGPRALTTAPSAYPLSASAAAGSMTAYVVTQPFTLGVLTNGTEVIYTNQPNAEARYVAKVSDTRRFSDLFTLAVSWQLASMLAGPIVKGQAGAAMADRCMRMALLYAAKAGALDGNQQKVEPAHVPDWMNARQ